MSQPVPAGWYPDPFGRHEHRHWDGTRWTEHVGSRGRQSIDPPGEATARSGVAGEQTAAGWYPDPVGRHEHRYWNGSQWTEHVGSAGRQGIDASAGQVVAPATGRPNKKARRQVRKAGAAHTQPGGGTLVTEQVLLVNQKAKLVGSTLGYAVYNQDGQQLGLIEELRRDLTTTLTDNLRLHNGSDARRTRRFQVVDMQSQVLLALTRPAMGFSMKAQLVIEGPGGAPIGQIVHESFGAAGYIATTAHLGVTNAAFLAWKGLGGVAGMVAGAALAGVQQRLNSAVDGLDKVGHARFGLEANGQRLGSIRAESTEAWDFNVRDAKGTEVARITKTWAGWAKERFTKADNYVVQMHRPLVEPLRSLVIAAALAIDLELKQQGDQVRGSAVSGTRRYK